MPNKRRIINLDDARRKQRGEPPLSELLSWIEELEDALETMTKANVATRAELESMLADLESQIPPEGK